MSGSDDEPSSYGYKRPLRLTRWELALIRLVRRFRVTPRRDPGIASSIASLDADVDELRDKLRVLAALSLASSVEGETVERIAGDLSRIALRMRRTVDLLRG